MKTKDVEELLGITKQSLIYYEKEGFIKPERLENNYRNYSLDDIKTLKFILLMRSMELSIEEIKLILDEKLNMKDALRNKQELLKKQNLELEQVQKKINEYIKRIETKVSFEKNSSGLILNNDSLLFDDIVIELKDIQNIKLSMCSQVYAINLLKVNMNYYVDMDIETKRDTYLFQIMNENKYKDMFDYLQLHQLKIDDPLHLIDIYHKYQDKVERYNYIHRNFRQWAKQYNLDNPRTSVKRFEKTGIDVAKDIYHMFKFPFHK